MVDLHQGRQDYYEERKIEDFFREDKDIVSAVKGVGRAFRWLYDGVCGVCDRFVGYSRALEAARHEPYNQKRISELEVIIARDASERRGMFNSLKQRLPCPEKLYSAFSRNYPVLLLRENTIFNASEKFLEQLGYTQKEIAGKDYRDFLDGSEEYKDFIASWFYNNDSESLRINVRGKNKNGNVVVTKVPLPGLKSKQRAVQLVYAGTITIFTDFNWQKEEVCQKNVEGQYNNP